MIYIFKSIAINYVAEVSKKGLINYYKKLKCIYIHNFIYAYTYRREVRRKANLEEPGEEKLVSPEKRQKCAHSMAFSRETGFSSSELRNWLLFVPRDDMRIIRTMSLECLEHRILEDVRLFE